MVFRILDATSFYAGIPFLSQDINYTTPLVFEEVKHIKKDHGAITVLIESDRLKIIEPEKKFIEMTLEKSEETGDHHHLSKEDVSVIALGLQLGGELVTDDFAVSNVAKHLNLKVIPVMTKGANKVSWVYFCPGCKSNFSKDSICPICGSKLMRKSSKR
ncbi:MAG: nucleotide-binding protein [Thaumarchaeota archaeon]|nr:nucleotide-binding protein [Nitrososphaerota archaeon]MDE1866335.1 nucleotide-binding protein [Nitrososphaerota archaeon]